MDSENLGKAISRLPKALITPNESECEDCVANEVYICSALPNSSELIIPYAMSDYATSFTPVHLNDLLSAMI